MHKKKEKMKKLILLTALMFIGMVSIAQNYLGKSLTEVKSILDSKSIEYDEYINGKSMYSIKYYTDKEERIYVFDFADKCIFYVINFSDAELVYTYAKLFTKQGYILQDNNEDKVKWIFKKANVVIGCIDDDENYGYSIVVKIK